MPTYTYKCIECKEEFNIFHSIKKNPQILCRKCGHKTKRQIGTGLKVIFTGTGFYETDYKTNQSQP